MQEQDNPATSAGAAFTRTNPASNRFAGPDCRQLCDVRAARVRAMKRCSPVQTAAAAVRHPAPKRPQPPRVKRRNSRQSRGLPSPSYQGSPWTVPATANCRSGTDANSGSKSPLGLSRYVRSRQQLPGRRHERSRHLSGEPKLRCRIAPSQHVHGVARSTRLVCEIGDDIDPATRRIEVEKAQEQFHSRLRRRKILRLPA